MSRTTFSISRLPRIVAGLAMLLAFGMLASGQEPAGLRGGPDDWTHHHLIFSDPGAAGDAMRKGAYAQWSKIVNDPRFILQRAKRDAAARRHLRLDGILPERNVDSLPNVNSLASVNSFAGDREPPHAFSRVMPTGLPRGIARAPGDQIANAGSGEKRRDVRRRRRQESQSLQKDWSEDMGAASTVGLGMYPAKYSFNIGSDNCGNAAQPDYVVFNTSSTGLSTQASIIAYDNLYSGCAGTVPSTYWAYNTGGAVMTSVVLSLDGSQVAFAQSSTGGAASLVLLKWKASTTESASTPVTPTAATSPANYRTCTAPCSLTLAFTGGANDTASSVFCDYATDTIYVGDDAGRLHKFIGVFGGAPSEASGAWPISVSLSALDAPVFDSSSGNVLVGDYLLDLSSTCAPTGDPCGFFYSVDASTGAIVGTSNRLDYVFGIMDGPLVDSSAGKAYVSVGADGNSESPSACGTDVACSGVFQFSTNFTSGSGTEATIGLGFEFLLSGTFDNEYYSSANSADPTGHIYVVGDTGAGNNTLYQISINSGVMNTTATTGPAVSSNFTNGFFSAGLQVSEVFTGSKDYIFLSVLSFGAPVACNASIANGCVMGFDVTSASISPTTAPTGATPEAGGTSGIIVDNTSTFGGASNIYYTPLASQVCATSGGTGGCAVQISQSAP